jgi:hypothetical protein
MGNLLRKIKTFGGRLLYSDDIIEQAENIIGKSKEDMTDEQYKKFQDLLPKLKEEQKKFKEEGVDVSKGSTGGAVNKRKKGNKIISPKKNKKIKYAGRLAKRGYGKARK